MNTSRDIEKLFDHFGGNAGDYQEIGRENEAKTARTRWPLLATLDFAQPTIPEIAPRRDVQTNALRSHAAEPDTEASAAATPTPILRGRQQLFTRPHRRTIPPVKAPAAESLSALRFSVLGESASNETGATPDSAAAPVTGIPPVQAPVESKPVANNANAVRQAAPQPERGASTFGSSFLARRAPAQAVPPVSEPAPAASQSILGKLFKPQTQTAASAPAGSLDAMFDRLRHASPHAGESSNTQASADRASRLPRS
ncbi:cellulose biosynthesis protein BcsP [Caballeronia insecticola]|uniref:Cellulose biosynthesis protein BcsR n=1 Tax=Caballeronia insecticola TaxID=758793 RepID=R4WVS6_9BURK|nr:cellulose biosynthesis protein BcsP [Caballeronia insecticola]BAN25145.1 putative uncharacterized protein [Caballeronia insecticola]